MYERSVVLFLACLVSFFLAALLGPMVIHQLKKLQFGQSIREEGPASHQKKSGTPTIGGLIFLIPILISSFVFLQSTTEFAILLVLTLGYGVIGFLDDFIKVGLKRNLGLTAKQKLVGQILLASGVFWLLTTMEFDTSVSIPLTSFTFDLGWVGYFFFFLFLTVGTTNATNLTDGLDGLLTGLAIIACSTFGVIAYVMEEMQLFTFALILVGSLVGFLLFNSNPAKVFMGDTGSLAIGGALVGLAVLTKTEFLLAIIGGVFVLETLSVILQVASYKTRKKRIFIMTPIHHSFEHIGWSEQKVVSRFWYVGIICSMIGLSLFTL